jgi:hypothetical protein
MEKEKLNHIDLQCPHCGQALRIGLDIELLCSVWCPMCKENLEFRGDHFVSLRSKAYGWLHGLKEFRVG